MFKVESISAFNDNYIWVLSGQDSNSLAVVDPGDASPVLEYLNRTGKTLSAILITHHHRDHTGGVAQLTAQFNIPVYGPENSPFSGITEPLKDGDGLKLFNHCLQVKAVPAHTLDHIAYLQPDLQPQLFCGDTLFLAGCGRLFEGTAEQMHKAMNYFASLPKETEVYCTHEYSLANLKFAKAVDPDNRATLNAIDHCTFLRAQGTPTLPSTIGAELSFNPFMRVSDPLVKASAEKHVGHSLQSEIEVLSVIREWKNSF